MRVFPAGILYPKNLIPLVYPVFPLRGGFRVVSFRDKNGHVDGQRNRGKRIVGQKRE